MDGRIKSGHDGVLSVEEQGEPGADRVDGQTRQQWNKSGHDVTGGGTNGFKLRKHVTGIGKRARDGRERVACRRDALISGRNETKYGVPAESLRPGDANGKAWVMVAGTMIDLDGAGVRALEDAEAYFRRERVRLREIRCTLEECASAPARDRSAFDELDLLFFEIVQRCQEIRWLVMIHDGAASPTTGKTFTSGAKLVSSLTTP